MITETQIFLSTAADTAAAAAAVVVEVVVVAVAAAAVVVVAAAAAEVVVVVVVQSKVRCRTRFIFKGVYIDCMYVCVCRVCIYWSCL